MRGGPSRVGMYHRPPPVSIDEKRTRRGALYLEKADPAYIADPRARCTPPLVVVARIVGPPEPRSTLISFGRRPRSVIGTFSGNSEFTFPFTVLVSMCAE